MSDDFFSTNSQTLSDDRSRVALRNDLLNKCFTSYVDGVLSGISSFDCVCLTNPVTEQQGKLFMSNTDIYHPIRVRPLEVHGFILPDPCAAEDSRGSGYINNLVSNHPIAFSSRPVSNGERVPTFGDILHCRVEFGPKDSGKMRILRYEYPIHNHIEKYECASKFLNSSRPLSGLFFGTLMTSTGKTNLSSLNQPLYNYDVLYENWMKEITREYPKKKTFYTRHDDLFRRAANAYGIEPALLKGISWAENTLKDKGCSGAGACGIMQFMKSTAEEQGLVVGIYYDERNIPEKAIFAAAKYLKWIYNSKYVNAFSGKEKWAMSVAAYNTGIGNVQRYGIGVLKSTWSGGSGETGKYVARVFAARDYLVNIEGYR